MTDLRVELSFILTLRSYQRFRPTGSTYCRVANSITASPLGASVAHNRPRCLSSLVGAALFRTDDFNRHGGLLTVNPLWSMYPQDLALELTKMLR